MTSGQLAGWAGGIAGVVIGLAGGVVGTYFSIKNTNGSRERAFMLKLAAAWWLAFLGLFALLLILPNPYRWLIWIPYGIILPLGIMYGNRKQQAIRQQDAQEHTE